MHRVHFISLPAGLYPPNFVSMHHRTPGLLLLIGAGLLASFGLGLAVQSWLQAGQRRSLWCGLGKVASGFGWLLPVVGIIVAYSYLVRPNLNAAWRAPSLPRGVEVRRTNFRWENARSNAFVVPIIPAIPQSPASPPGDMSLAERGLPAEEPSAPALPVPPAKPNVAPAGLPPQTPGLVEKKSPELTPVESKPPESKSTEAKSDEPKTVKTAAKRPEWVDEKAVKTGDSRRIVVVGKLGLNPESAEAEGVAAAIVAVRRDFAQHYPVSDSWQPPAKIVRDQAIKQTYIEAAEHTTSTSDTHFKTYRAYCQVELSPALSSQLFPYWREEIVGRRLWSLGGLAGLLTLTFGTVAAYFRLDERTSGHYRRRLKLAAVSIIAAGGLAAAMLL
jgi:hypothetical protein